MAVQLLLKRGLKNNLPASAGNGEPLIATDTQELFIGTGTGIFPLRVDWSNILNVPAVGGVTSVNGHTGIVSLTTSDVGEGSNLYYTDVRVDARIAAQKGAVNGLATLDANGVIPTAQIPALAITETFVVASQAAMLALTAQRGDVAIRTDTNTTFILSTDDPTTLGNWKQVLTPGSGVTSVNGFSGVVSLNSDNITEGTTNLYYTNVRVGSYLATLKNAANGIAGLDSSGLLSAAVLPATIDCGTY